MPTFGESFPAIESALADQYGPPAPETGRDDEPFTALAAVLLGRSIESRKVVRALSVLEGAGLLDPRALAEAELSEILETLRSAGLSVPPRSVAPLCLLARWLVERHQGSAEALRDPTLSIDQLREELAGLNGIGPATADTLLLLGVRRAAYPVDRASYRILVRHGWLDPSAEYDEARSLVIRQHPEDPEALARLSHWLERLGREFCRATVAHCERCPLRPFLPEGGPVEPDGS